MLWYHSLHISHCIILSFPLSGSGSVNARLELSPGAFNSSDDVGNGVMNLCSKQSASVIDLASAALKSTAHAYFSFYASGVQLVMIHAAALPSYSLEILSLNLPE